MDVEQIKHINIYFTPFLLHAFATEQCVCHCVGVHRQAVGYIFLCAFSGNYIARARIKFNGLHVTDGHRSSVVKSIVRMPLSSGLAVM